MLGSVVVATRGLPVFWGYPCHLTVGELSISLLRSFVSVSIWQLYWKVLPSRDLLCFSLPAVDLLIEGYSEASLRIKTDGIHKSVWNRINLESRTSSTRFKKKMFVDITGFLTEILKDFRFHKTMSFELLHPLPKSVGYEISLCMSNLNSFYLA